MRASHKDLLSVQKSVEIEGWLAVVDVHNNSDSMATTSSLYELVNVLPLVLMVVTTSGWRGDPLVTNCCYTLISCPSTSRSICVNGVISLI